MISVLVINVNKKNILMRRKNRLKSTLWRQAFAIDLAIGSSVLLIGYEHPNYYKSLSLKVFIIVKCIEI